VRSKLTIERDQVALGEMVFDLKDEPEWEAESDERPRIGKTSRQLSSLVAYFSRREFRPRNIFELGIWDGGSTIFWHELFRPTKHVAVDLLKREDGPALRSYRTRNEALRTYWSVDQADSERIREIVAAEFDGPLDLVIDDASHLLEPTRASFATLFPLLRPDGIYLIEDWDWELYPHYQPPETWGDQRGLSRLAYDFVNRVPAGAARALTVERSFLAVER
jgi:Methyltransferase domain